MTTRTRGNLQIARITMLYFRREQLAATRRVVLLLATVTAYAALILTPAAAAPLDGMTCSSLAFVPVGDAGNAGELSGAGAGGVGPDRICGGVSYAYEMQRCEVTAAEYVGFLNAVGANDLYGLYSPEMFSHAYGCRIERSGVPGGYSYSVADDWRDRPVNFVNWGDAARFANWLANGQPTGAQGPGTTEDGSYTLNGAMSDAELGAVVRNPGASYVIPSEDEWYKAAYFRTGTLGDSYWSYPTRSNEAPDNRLLNPDPGNNANFYDLGYTLGFPYFRNVVGAFHNSPSGYGTFDQGGNVKEWTEGVIWETQRCVRGGSCFYGIEDLHANKRIGILPSYSDNDLGFRVALAPEPTAALLLLLGAAAVRRRG